MSNTRLNFKKGTSFSQYEAGTIYFESSTGLIKVGTGETTCNVFGGVIDASIQNSTLVLTLANGSTVQVDYSDCQSHEAYVADKTVTDASISALETAVNNMDSSISDLDERIDDIVTAGGEPNQINGIKIDSSVLGVDSGKYAVLGSAALKSDTYFDRAGAAADVSALLGSGFDSTTNTVAAKIADAIAQAQAGATKVNAKDTGHVTVTVASSGGQNAHDIVTVVENDIASAQDLSDLSALVGTLPADITATTVVGYVDEKSVDAANAAVAGIIDNAPEAFDTLKEIADWIGTGDVASTTAASMLADIETLKGTVGDSTKGLVKGLADVSTAAAGKISSVTGETATTNDNFVAVSVEAATNSTTKAVTLSSHAHVNTGTLANVTASSPDALATVNDVKQYVDNAVLLYWQTFE